MSIKYSDEIPKPPKEILQNMTENYLKLYQGVRSRIEPVTWRSLIVDVKELLGSSDPENRSLTSGKYKAAIKLLNVLLEGTFLELLIPEILFAMGFDKLVQNDNENLDVLLLNAHHTSEPLLWTLADHYKKIGKKVAVVNPVGHYSDRQIRILSVGELLRNVKKVIILSSTQYIYGGSLTVLSNTIRTLRNINFASKVDEVDVIFPMFGGSRGHRIGQLGEIGYEVLEAVFNAKILALTTKDLKEKLESEIGELTPKFRFFSVDVHHVKSAEAVFRDEGFVFKSISPSLDIADSAYKLLKEKKLLKFPIRLIACDTGAIHRTESLAEKLLTHKNNTLKMVDVVYIRKVRQTAGVVKDVRIEKVLRWKKLKVGIIKKVLPQTKKDNGKYILIYSDDMIDTGGTAKKDITLLSEIYPKAKLVIFAATHPILSKGSIVLDEIGADYYLLGNTLNPEHLSEHKKVKIVNLASSCVNAIVE